MSVYTCDTPGCDTEYSAGERGEDSLFVSFSVSPHDVEGIEKRAFSLCADCARELDSQLPGGDDDALDVVCGQCDTRYHLTEDSTNDCPECGYVDWEVA